MNELSYILNSIVSTTFNIKCSTNDAKLLVGNLASIINNNALDNDALLLIVNQLFSLINNINENNFNIEGLVQTFINK